MERKVYALILIYWMIWLVRHAIKTTVFYWLLVAHIGLTWYVEIIFDRGTHDYYTAPHMHKIGDTLHSQIFLLEAVSGSQMLRSYMISMGRLSTSTLTNYIFLLHGMAYEWWYLKRSSCAQVLTLQWWFNRIVEISCTKTKNWHFISFYFKMMLIADLLKLCSIWDTQTKSYAFECHFRFSLISANVWWKHCQTFSSCIY